jgi:hypothetical protein
MMVVAFFVSVVVVACVSLRACVLCDVGTICSINIDRDRSTELSLALSCRVDLSVAVLLPQHPRVRALNQPTNHQQQQQQYLE